ncbi:uncharacterized protein BJX67DRAFT_384693 [Aspergillus lucknowensis]|uniref:Uncharacterized protein n=1 Tax=Aspergillus lucknowensis TaxID=176173 RepID=A0ABR4LFQ6_9EURO
MSHPPAIKQTLPLPQTAPKITPTTNPRLRTLPTQLLVHKPGLPTLLPRTQRLKKQRMTQELLKIKDLPKDVFAPEDIAHPLNVKVHQRMDDIAQLVVGDLAETQPVEAVVHRVQLLLALHEQVQPVIGGEVGLEEVPFVIVEAENAVLV